MVDTGLLLALVDPGGRPLTFRDVSVTEIGAEPIDTVLELAGSSRVSASEKTGGASDTLPPFRQPTGLPRLRGDEGGDAESVSLMWLPSFCHPKGRHTLRGSGAGNEGGKTVPLRWLPSLRHPNGLPTLRGEEGGEVTWLSSG